MGAMRKNLLFLLVAVAFVSAPAMAELTVEQTTDAEYIINNGYSQVMAEDIFMLKNRVSGKPIEPLYEKSQNKFVRAWKKFYAYVDPSIENEDRIHHDIAPSPSYTDL